MATAEEYANWIVANADKKGTPEFEKVAKAYTFARSVAKPKAPIETPAFEKEAAAIANATPAEVIAGNPVTRFALGAADMLRGGAQLAGNAVGLGSMFNENESQLQGLIDRGRQAYGSEGMDLSRLAGGILSPVGLGVAKGLAPAASAAQRIGQGAAIGAGGGLLNPVPNATSTGDYLGTAAMQGGLGMVIGGAIPGALEGGKAVIRGGRNMIDEFLPGGASRAVGRLGNAAAGTRAPDVIRALEGSADNVPGSNLTAGQASVPANSAEFAALQKIAAEANPSLYAGLKGVEGKQEAARKALIDTIANDPAFANPSVDPRRAAELVRAANAAMSYSKVRGDMISPIAPEEVYAARIAEKLASKAGALQNYGQMATQAAQLNPRNPDLLNPARQLVRSEPNGNFPTTRALPTEGGTPSFTPVPGQPNVSARYGPQADRAAEFQAGAKDALAIAAQRQKEADFLQYQMDALIKTVGPENPKLAALLQRPSMRQALESAQLGAQESGGYFPKDIGQPFSVANLQRMKMAMDDIIKDPKTFGIKATEAQEIGNTRNEFVKWLSMRSPNWAKARDQYAADSVPINQMDVGRELRKSLGGSMDVAERPTVFANAVQNAPQTIKRALDGQPRFQSLSDVLSPEQVGKVQSVLRDLSQDAQFEKLAGPGMSAARRITGKQLDTIPQIGMLDRAAMVINNITRRIEGFGGERTMKQLAVTMQDPKEMARLMKAATPAERKEISDVILRIGAANATEMLPQ